MWSSRVSYLLFLSFESFTAPTLPPTTAAPSTTPTDECDDDQASCHSGTGDDYDVTGANIALVRLRARPHPTLPRLFSPIRPQLTPGLLDVPFVAVRSDSGAARTHAGAHARAGTHQQLKSPYALARFQIYLEPDLPQTRTSSL